MRVLPLLLLPALLSACPDRQMPDLRLYVEQIKARPASGIPPMPEPAPVQTFTYTPGDRPDPFAAQLALLQAPPDEENAAARSSIQPDLQRPRETLENYPLDSLRMVGTLQRAAARWALVRSEDGVIHRVAVGNHMGQQHGRILDIQEARISLVELVPSADGYREKPVAIGLENIE